MNKTSKVIAIQSSGTWEGSFGLMYKFEISFENGDTGEYSGKSKDQTKFVIGTEAEYTYTGGTHPKIKPIYTPQTGGATWQPNAERDLKIVKQSCLKASVELVGFGSIKFSQLLTTADKLVAWVNSTEAKKESEFVNIPKKETTDLPF